MGDPRAGPVAVPGLGEPLLRGPEADRHLRPVAARLPERGRQLPGDGRVLVPVGPAVGEFILTPPRRRKTLPMFLFRRRRRRRQSSNSSRSVGHTAHVVIGLHAVSESLQGALKVGAANAKKRSAEYVDRVERLNDELIEEVPSTSCCGPQVPAAAAQHSDRPVRAGHRHARLHVGQQCGQRDLLRQTPFDAPRER